MYDIIIKNGTVYSGRNEAPQRVDIAIQDDRIVKIASNIEADAKEEVDATGLTITPGFIDPHASTGFGYFFPKAADHKLYQGITTEIFGNCGTSPAPIGERLIPTMQRLSKDIGFPFEWSTLAEYFNQIKENIQFNIATLIGHSTLRGGYLSDWHNVPEANQLAMQKATAQAMNEGALGISTGLIYSPGCFAETEEIVALAKIAAEKGGIYASHIRSEREEIEQAVDEALHIGEAANCNVLISHLKAAEQSNWGKIPGIIQKLENYNKTHDKQAWVDVYPYTAVSTKLKAFIPKDFLSEGTTGLTQRLLEESAHDIIANYIVHKNYHLDQMLIIANNDEQYVSKTVKEVAEEKKLTLAATVIEVLLSDNDTWIVYHCISNEDMDSAILWPKAMICTDSWSYPINAPKTIGNPHPRSYGAFTTYLENYVIKRNLLSIEEAIYKVTHLPASVFNIKDRGLIEEGCCADIVAFKWDEIKANATYIHPKRLSEGVQHLWVNGKQVIKNKEVQDSCPGAIIKLTSEEVTQ